MIAKLSMTILSAVVISACVPLNSGEQLRDFAPTIQGNTQSDYAILDCENLAIIAVRLLERIKASRGNLSMNQGRLGLLEAELDDVKGAQRLKACTEIRPLETGTAVVSASGFTTQMQPRSERSDGQQSGAARPQQYLQVATFNDRQNAKHATHYFQTRGFEVQNRPMRAAGQSPIRVLIGPFDDVSAKRAASLAVRQYGANDAFWTVE